jgi:hypothetical protein
MVISVICAITPTIVEIISRKKHGNSDIVSGIANLINMITVLTCNIYLR